MPAAARRVALLIGAAAILPVAAGAWPSPLAAANEPAGAFSPPTGSMVLTRTLRRPLTGDAEVVTTRRYEVRFVREDDGYRLDGRLLDVMVKAPPALEPLAALERARPDDGMFPMRLDAGGGLRPLDGPGHSEQVREAGLRAGAAVGTLALPPFDHAQASDFARFFEERSVRTDWPRDLFRPRPGRREESRTVTLVNGARGDVTVTTDASADAASGMLSVYTRRVTTSLSDTASGEHRVTDETWTLLRRSDG